MTRANPTSAGTRSRRTPGSGPAARAPRSGRGDRGLACRMPYSNPEEQRLYQRQWYAARKAQWIAEHGPCVRCGSTEDLQVDHKDPSQKVNHRVWSWSAERREAELAKCQVLCRPCHVEKKDHVRQGEQHGRARLTGVQVMDIRQRALAGESLVSAGAVHGVDRKTAWDVVHKSWQHLNEM